MNTDFSSEANELKDKIISHLLSFGFTRCSESSASRDEASRLCPPKPADKAQIRRLHAPRREFVLSSNRSWIEKHEGKVLKYFANGVDIKPEAIAPQLIEIRGSGWQNDLFRYATYLWSIPVSRGFGRSMRYLVMDKNNNKLLGIFGLTDPVIGLKTRDTWIGWTKAQKEDRLWHVLDAYILGAVPPYTSLLGAKLVASILTCNEVREDFRRKYEGKPAVISGKVREGNLVMITTNTALGRSSVLNRLKYKNRLLWEYVGWTSSAPIS
jgi:hypothetical protein